jgi:long-chain acyl-CoA synthetase
MTLAEPSRQATPSTATTDAAMPASLIDLLADSVARFSQSPLFSEKKHGRWVELSYRALADAVDELRAGLAGLGVDAGDRVGIISGNRSEWAVVAYATYGRGAALVPMYETQRAVDWAFIARDAGVKVLFVANATIAKAMNELRADLPELTKIILLGEEGAGDGSFAGLRAAGRQAPVAARKPAPGDTACLMYTSGTTGDPKGVVLSHHNIVSNVYGLRSVIPLEARHRTLSFLPWAHALGHTVELHMLIASGASTGIAESVEQLVANFGEVKPTVLVAVPRVFQRIYAGVEKLMAEKPGPVRALYRAGLGHALTRARGGTLGPVDRAVLALADRVVFAKIRQRFGGRLTFAVSGAAALEREVAEFIEALGIQVYEGYGLTETSPVVSANVPGQKRLGSVGKPLPDVRVVIDRSVSADGRDGEIVVYGPNVMAGYHNRPAETRAMFSADRGLRTGDLGYLDDDGFLFITGRIKELYKLANGKYVAPVPLEERLKLSPFIANAMVYGDNSPCNVALIVPDLSSARALCGGDPFTDEGLRLLRVRIGLEIARLSEGWKGYERVRGFAILKEDFTLENGLLTPSLKLKRRNVIARFEGTIKEVYRSLPADHAD